MVELSSPRLLLVDENAQDRELASLVLRQAMPGLEITEVEDVEQLQSALRRGYFDLAITEFLFSWTDGLAVMRMLRRERPRLPILAFSEMRDEEIVVEAMRAGFSDYRFKSSRGFLELPDAVRKAWEQETDRILAARGEPSLGTLLDRSGIGIYRTTPDGRLVESSPALLRLLGVKDLEDALKLNLPEPYFLSEDRDQLLRRLSSDRTRRSREVRVQNSDGSVSWLSLTEVLQLDVDNEIVIDVLVQDITHLKQEEETIRRKLQELEQSNADLSQFAYMASHELQQPLRMVEKFGEILQEEYGDRLGDDGSELLASVTEGAHRMQDLIDDLLALSRIDTEGGELIEVDSNELLHEAILGMEDDINESDAAIHSDLLPKVRGDRSQLVQLWRNLISNAIKFRGEESPRIAISARQQDQDWVFSITDNGIGVDPQELHTIFTIFRRLHPELPGTGIGLSLCRGIVERHGGRIWAETLDEGGSRFSFTLPRIEDDEGQSR